jgi:hypothetical protein
MLRRVTQPPFIAGLLAGIIQTIKTIDNMKNIGLIILVFLTFTFCGSRHEGEQKTGLLSNLVKITDNEDKGVKEILKNYGGQCKYSIGMTISASDGNKKYFELEMSKSELIEKYSQIVEMPASNVAYLFYKNLKEEKSKYDEIHIVIIFNDGAQKTFVYPVARLETVNKKMAIVNKLIGLIKDKKFEAIKPMLNDTSFVKYDKNELINSMAKIEPTIGTIKEFLPYGFRFHEMDNGRENLHISGVIIRDQQSNEFSIDIDPNSTKEEVIIFDYKL